MANYSSRTRGDIMIAGAYGGGHAFGSRRNSGITKKVCPICGQEKFFKGRKGCLPCREKGAKNGN